MFLSNEKKLIMLHKLFICDMSSFISSSTASSASTSLML